MNWHFRLFRNSRVDKHIAHVRRPVERTWERFFALLGKFVSIYGMPTESNPPGNCHRCHKRPQASPGPLCYECFEWVCFAEPGRPQPQPSPEPAPPRAAEAPEPPWHVSYENLDGFAIEATLKPDRPRSSLPNPCIVCKWRAPSPTTLLCRHCWDEIGRRPWPLRAGMFPTPPQPEPLEGECPY